MQGESGNRSSLGAGMDAAGFSFGNATFEKEGDIH